MYIYIFTATDYGGNTLLALAIFWRTLSVVFLFSLFPPSLFHNYYMWTVDFSPCSWVLSVRRCCKSSQLHSRCWVFVPVPKRLRGATGAAVSTSPEPPRHLWNDRLCMWALWTFVFSCGHSTANDRMHAACQMVRTSVTGKNLSDILWWDCGRCPFFGSKIWARPTGSKGSIGVKTDKDLTCANQQMTPPQPCYKWHQISIHVLVKDDRQQIYSPLTGQSIPDMQAV